MQLGERPWIDETALVEDATLCTWTAVGPRSHITQSYIGDYSYVMNDCNIMDAQIGKFCSIAAHNRVNPQNHPLWRAALHHFSYRSLSYGLGEHDDHDFFQWRRDHRVVIGHDVWIGHGAVILPGVTLGTGCAVGAGSVVTRDVAPFTVVAGNPAKQIRRRAGEEAEVELMRIAWWDWSRDQLRDAMEDFRSLTLEQFADKYRGKNAGQCLV